MPSLPPGISGQCPRCAAALERAQPCQVCRERASCSPCSTRRGRLLFFCGALVLGTLLSAPLDAMQLPLLSVERLLADSLGATAYFFSFRRVCRGMQRSGPAAAGRTENAQADECFRQN